MITPRIFLLLAVAAGVIGFAERPRSSRVPDVLSDLSVRQAAPTPTQDEQRPCDTPAVPGSPPAGETGDPAVARQVAAISRDYSEMRRGLTTTFDEVVRGDDGLSAYLGRLALLDREERRDLAGVLLPAAVERLEMQEKPAGHVVEELLRGTNATAEQRRLAFRLQAEFENRFGLDFDFTPAARLNRERANCTLQEKIRLVLGDELFAVWLVGMFPDLTKNDTAPIWSSNLRAGSDASPVPVSPVDAIDAWRRGTDLNLRRLENLAAADAASPNPGGATP